MGATATAMLYALATVLTMPQDPNVPVRMGVSLGLPYLTMHGIPFWTHAPFFEALDELGASVVCIHPTPVTDAGEENSQRTAQLLDEIDSALRTHRLQYMLNVEASNFPGRLEVTPGIDEYERPDGTRRWDLRMEWLDPLLPPEKPGPPALVGVTYDEIEHMILSNNKFASPTADYDKPYWVDTHGMPLTDAYDRLVENAVAVRIDRYQDRVLPQTEQVWPDLFHIFARAGWVIGPKLLKEHLSSVVMSIALGAAVQYQQECGGLWCSPDLWNYGRYPGHSPEALRSALLMGYWLGSEIIYVENLDYYQIHDNVDPDGSLIAWSDPWNYTLTAYGRVFRDFAKDYVPAHPRAIRWQDYDPRVAIIRLPDGGWGQYSAGPGHPESEARNRLLGNREMPLDQPASEWLHVWPILTHGAARPGAISAGNPFVYPNQIEEFFVPVDSVAVFDHNVGPEALRNIECMVVCGHALTADAFAAIAERTAAGATCVIARRLYNAHAQGQLPGDWRIIDDFRAPEVEDALQPFLGPPDLARFRFKHHVVEFRRAAVPDGINVVVKDRAANPSAMSMGCRPVPE